MKFEQVDDVNVLKDELDSRNEQYQQALIQIQEW